MNATVSQKLSQEPNLTSDLESRRVSKVLDELPNHHSASDALWWFDLYSVAGRKSENQDSVLITTCLPELHSSGNNNTLRRLTPSQHPILVLLADGVSACQFPKQASRLAINTIAHKITQELAQLAESQSQTSPADSDSTSYQLQNATNGLASKQAQTVNRKAVNKGHDYTDSMSFDDEQVASLIQLAVNKANDSLYFSQAYQRVPPLLSTLSGVLCIGDRIHLFHTGDSRIYRVTANSLTILTTDYRIHHGQDKGALSAALGADTDIDLQQTVFTLHQNECLALMTDGVYESIDPIEMQFDLCTYSTELFATPSRLNAELLSCQISKKLCNQAFEAGSNDNLSVVLLGMTAQSRLADSTNEVGLEGCVVVNTSENPASNLTQYRLPTGLQIGDSIDGFTVVDVIACTARSEVYLVHDDAKHEFVLKAPSMHTVDDGHYLREFLKERKIGLSLSKYQRAGQTAYNQNDPNRLSANSGTASLFNMEQDTGQYSAPAAPSSGLLRYYPVPASSPYLYHLTEYIDGESLRTFIERHAPCDVWQTHDLLTKIGMAVRVMHRNYLLHQDIKPENVLLTKSGAVKLIDFGSASSSILKDSTRPPNGDLHYAAPEYYTDAPKGVHSDLFSIAVIGFELLTGKLPFSSQALMNPSQSLIVPAQLLRQHRVPASSQQALMRALHSNTNARYQAIGEFLQDFNPDNSATLSDPEPLIKRNPLLVWHGICFIQGIIIIILLIRLLSFS
ncbi:bifunctional protein-serine/threonine kinase/phosphatase [Psychrobacter pygoscelis]|uniref:bifunctional protein-serine/threonine kinase/phosphatase n=1 Tax=Psychrobacter pygoscelis TaxID=2488563 RepID=UPI001F602FA2|nr:bifunctional protein-serine/threonine kinase/phosphatase [Psychrobacter pygoscelis]